MYTSTDGYRQELKTSFQYGNQDFALEFLMEPLPWLQKEANQTFFIVLNLLPLQILHPTING